MNHHTTYTILNVLWFGVFVAGIFYLHWTPWCLAVPVLVHFTMSDLNEKGARGKDDNDKYNLDI